MQTKRVIFVGVHYKPGMDALDSKTKSGKVIDAVIRFCGLGGQMTFQKSNLFHTDFMPEKYNIELIAHQWALREKYDPANDIIVALGKFVQTGFKIAGFRFVTVRHPARAGSLLKYKTETLEKILKAWQ